MLVDSNHFSGACLLTWYPQNPSTPICLSLGHRFTLHLGNTNRTGPGALYENAVTMESALAGSNRLNPTSLLTGVGTGLTGSRSRADSAPLHFP